MSALMSIFTPMRLPPLDRAFGDCRVERLRHLDRLVHGDLFEPDRVAPRDELPDLPRRGGDQRGIADETTQAGSVGHEDDRLVATHVDGPHGVAIVEDVGRVTARDAAAGASPLPLVRLQADPHAVRVAIHLPRVAEEERHVVGRHVIGVRLGAAHGLDLRVRSVLGAEIRPVPPGFRRTWSPFLRARPSKPPKPPTVKVARLPMYSGTSNAPLTATYDLKPAPLSIFISSRSPALTATLSQSGTGVPLRVACVSAPVRARARRSWKRALSPPTITSSAAAPCALPTSRLAVRNAKWSIGPAGYVPRSR